MLAQKFGGRPIDEGNLYQWRSHGFEDWLACEDRRDRLKFEFEHLANLDAVDTGSQVAERLSVIVASELNMALRFLDNITDLQDRWNRLQEICKELNRFRRENYHHGRLRLAEQRLENETERKRNSKVARVTLSAVTLAEADPRPPLQLQPNSAHRATRVTPPATDHALLTTHLDQMGLNGTKSD